MGIVSHCYYDDGVISQKFQFVLRYILGTRSLGKNLKAIENLSPVQEVEQAQDNNQSEGSLNQGDSAKQPNSNKTADKNQNEDINQESQGDSMEVSSNSSK